MTNVITSPIKLGPELISGLTKIVKDAKPSDCFMAEGSLFQINGEGFVLRSEKEGPIWKIFFNGVPLGDTGFPGHYGLDDLHAAIHLKMSGFIEAAHHKVVNKIREVIPE